MSTETNNILAPTDFSEICDNAIKHGAVLAGLLNAKLHILHVVNADSKSFMKKGRAFG